MIRKLLLYIRTIKYLLPEQVFYRIYYNFIRRNFYIKNYKFKIRIQNNNKLIYLKKNNSIIGENTFKFINLEYKIDNKWQIENNNKLWIYNLHYFDYLNSNYTNNNYLNNLIKNWIELSENHKKIGLDPYPTSLRVINWIKFFIKNDIRNKEFNVILINKIIFLSKNFEYHLLGNHYFANIKAIIFGCLYFNSKDLDKILKNVLDKLYKELNNQILSDGGHAEFSPMYHSIILEDILDIISIFKFYNLKLDRNLYLLIKKKVSLMLFWLSKLTHPNDIYCKFNDTTENIAQPYSKLLKYAQDLGFEKKMMNTNSFYFKNTGYFSYQNKNIFFCINVGKSSLDHLSGHTHADTLSFELSYKNQIFFSNGGISTYNEDKRREYERSSANHNTAIVNDRNSSEIWKSFRLARRIKIGKFKEENKNGSKKVSFFYFDYKNEYKQTRIVDFKKNKLIFKDDNNNFNFISRLILRPDIKINKISKDEVILYRKNISLKVISKSGNFDVKRFSFKKEFNLFKQTFCIDLNSKSNQCIYEIIFL